MSTQTSREKATAIWVGKIVFLIFRINFNKYVYTVIIIFLDFLISPLFQIASHEILEIIINMNKCMTKNDKTLSFMQVILYTVCLTELFNFCNFMSFSWDYMLFFWDYTSFSCNYMSFSWDYTSFSCNYISFSWDYMSFSCNYISLSCNYILFSCNYISFSCNYMSFSCNYCNGVQSAYF